MADPEKGSKIEPATGRLGVLIVGLGGAVSTTLVSGVEAINQGIPVKKGVLAEPIGSLTQMGRIRLGNRADGNNPLIREFVPLAELKDLVFGGWDIMPDNGYEAALHHEVLNTSFVADLRSGLEEVRPMPGVFAQDYVKRLRGTHIKKGADGIDLAEQVMDDVNRFKASARCDRVVMLFAASTESYIEPTAEHQDLDAFVKGLKESSPNIPPSQIYAYAALQLGIPFINGTPGLTVDIPALKHLAQERGVPVAGKDFKTGQTLVKTVLGPMFKARMLGIDGWFSTNILGNRDGEVLHDPGSFESKRVSKESVLDGILQPELYPRLYGDMDHQVHINYYRPKGDDKKGIDVVNFFGWMGYPMEMEISLQCKDSILAAPVALDLVLFMDLAQRAKMRGGAQEWLSFYFKSPMPAEGYYPEHDFFIQQMKLKNTLRKLRGQQPVTHLDEYYD